MGEGGGGGGGGNVNYYKSIHHPIPTCENRKHSENFENKLVRLSFQLSVQKRVLKNSAVRKFLLGNMML